MRSRNWARKMAKSDKNPDCSNCTKQASAQICEIFGDVTDEVLENCKTTGTTKERCD